MTKRNFSEQILDHSARMRYETLQAGVPERSYDQMCSGLDRLTNPQLLALLNWYKEVESQEYAEVLKIRSFVPPYVWESYRINPPPRLLNEQKLLSRAADQLRTRWLNRPLFKRKKLRYENHVKSDQSGTE